jgi:hypothetical protein
MRTFLKNVVWFAAIQIIIMAAVLWSYWRQYPPAQHFLAASIDKEKLLRTQASPRLIFIGGSSMAFGVNSAEIAQACDRRPVNMGLHAALGLKFMLKETAPHIRSNDWVIVAPEYQQFVRASGQSEMLMNLLEANPSAARLFTQEQWTTALDIGFVQRFGKMVRAVFGRPGRFFRKNTIVSNSRLYYRRLGFNANGDVVAHLDAKSKGLREREFRFTHRDELVYETIEQINRFSAAASARGAKVFFSHPPLPREVFEQNRTVIQRLETSMIERLKVPQLDSAEEMVYPIEDFFDTWYHLARTGVEKRTRFLAERMAQQANLQREALESAKQKNER